jgi:hypothetical protein
MRITIVVLRDGRVARRPHELLRTLAAGHGGDLVNSSGLVFRSPFTLSALTV